MNGIAESLSAIQQGNPQAAEQLLSLLHDELRRLAAQKMAAESPGQTLEATALVHEAYLRLVGNDHPQLWNSRGHFLADAAEAMRRIRRSLRLPRRVQPCQSLRYAFRSTVVFHARADACRGPAL